ncbi:glutaminyl-peptide cyclotransferase [Streptococcus pluranimalium]|uniref:Glutamine cyclotransferase n=1 Tax=Streptococcus pluranimalium TaxID=82348 RepID=A0A345VML9_9STRE|nr:glutaminyl-peptide cyclotransferase [Streptococcus pluranimalium]AXJ13971.1 hypothetical protein Sp14A_20870 [Streptococcus pluranimalium]
MKKIILLGLAFVALISGLFWFVSQVNQDDLVLKETITVQNPQFTQGFVWDNKTNQLLLGSGLYGQSVLATFQFDQKTWQIKDHLPSHAFGEGLALAGDDLWQITWKEQEAYRRDKETFDIKETVSYEGEGWGITYSSDDSHLIMSDGTNQLQFRDPKDFSLLKSIPVTEKNKAVTNINELEYANGFVYANIWQTNFIVKIDPNSGKVVKRYDLTDLVETISADVDVLNGIAHVEDDMFYITGKMYPVIWKVELH